MKNKPHARKTCGAKTRSGKPCKNAPMANGRCRMHGGKSTGPPPEKMQQNKNAVKTGEHESIWFDTLDNDEKKLVTQINTSKLQQLEEEIRLTTIRERRMLQRIQKLKIYDFTTVKITQGIEKGKKTDLEERQGILGQIQSIEEALTRVQAHKAKLIELKHRLEMDGEGGASDGQAIQNFIEATSKTPEEVAFLFEGDEVEEAQEASSQAL
jgi:uncharacterized protein YjcR